MMFKRLRDWLTVQDYWDAKDAMYRDVMARYSRGNIAMQQGRFMLQADLERLQREGDAAAARLRKLKFPA